MADINVERRGPGVWPWVIGLLVLALLIWALVEMFGTSAEPNMTGPAVDTTEIGPMDVDAPAAAPVPPPIEVPERLPADSPPATPDYVPGPGNTP